MRSECVAKSAPSSPRSAAQCGKHNCDTRLHGSSESSEPHKARIYAGCVAFGRKKPESATMAENRAFLLKKLRVRRLEPAAVGELRERLEQRLLVGCSTIISQKCERKKRNSFYWMQSINVDQPSWKSPPKKKSRKEPIQLFLWLFAIISRLGRCARPARNLWPRAAFAEARTLSHRCASTPHAPIEVSRVPNGFVLIENHAQEAPDSASPFWRSPTHT